jgi:hypothetical protein
MHYFFDRQADGNYNMAINTFITVEYGNRVGKGNWWHTIGAGYLVSSQGNYFGTNTYKFSVGIGRMRKFGPHFSPTLFVTDNFRTAFPGLRFGVGF